METKRECRLLVKVNDFLFLCSSFVNDKNAFLRLFLTLKPNILTLFTKVKILFTHHSKCVCISLAVMYNVCTRGHHRCDEFYCEMRISRFTFTEKLIVVNFWKYFIDLYVTFGFDKAAFLLDNCHPFKCQWQRMTGIHQTAHNNNKRYSRTAHSDDAPFNTTIISLPERHSKKIKIELSLWNA